MYLTDLGTGVAVLNSQVVPISQMVAKTGFTVNVFDFSGSFGVDWLVYFGIICWIV